jgi:hypothetical protein
VQDRSVDDVRNKTSWIFALFCAALFGLNRLLYVAASGIRLVSLFLAVLSAVLTLA